MSRLIKSLRPPCGLYPQRNSDTIKAVDRIVNRYVHAALKNNRVSGVFSDLLVRVNTYGDKLALLDHTELDSRVSLLREQLRLKGLNDDSCSMCFALVRELSERTLGMRHHDSQLQGGWVMLNGMIAEMETGQGKTLTAALPCAALAMAGFPVHVITVNDYLAQRDAETLMPLYRALGLSVGVVVSSSSIEEKKQAYSCDITYCTNKTLVFDYLRDRITLENRNSDLRMNVEGLYGDKSRRDRLLLRGLCFALVDEADSVLVDEARTPLIISGQEDNCQENEVYRQAWTLAGQLVNKIDYMVDTAQKNIILLDKGLHVISQLVEKSGDSISPAWKGVRRSSEWITLALMAREIFICDEHYMLDDGKVVIIDEYTGRPMPDRSWGRGLQQLVEIKEKCTITGYRVPLARISYQRFFRRYHRLAGMTGTANEISGELTNVYNLPVVAVPTHEEVKRRYLKPHVCLNSTHKWRYVIARVKRLHEKGRPILIGTRTVDASEQLSRLLHMEGLEHQLLNARQNQEESEIIASAGAHGSITIATNMAGRGTDIRLDDLSRDAGGLHVILTELHGAGRIDRQLFGRCARQGDPGSVEAIIALDDDVAQAGNLAPLLQGVPFLLSFGIGRWLAYRVIIMAQKRIERLHYKMRCNMLRYDQQLDETLSFSGYAE